MFKNHLTLAWRTLLRNKANAMINIIGLAIGVSACLVIFLIVTYETSFDRFHPGGEKIYRVYSRFTGQIDATNRGVPAGMGHALKAAMADPVKSLRYE